MKLSVHSFDQTGEEAFLSSDNLLDDAWLDHALTTLTKNHLSELLFEKVGLNKREAKMMVDMFFEKIMDKLALGEAVKLSGFGRFELRHKASRPGRNPKTGEKTVVSARRVVTFYPSDQLRVKIDALDTSFKQSGVSHHDVR